MNAAMPSPDDDSEEISALIETLHETSRRLEELTRGEVDTVASRDGRTILLRHAQDQLRHNEAAKQSAILNALPAHIALLNTQGLIVSVNEAWRRFRGAHVTQSPGYDVGLNYLDICDNAAGENSSNAHEIAQGIRSVLVGKSKRFSLEYCSDSTAEADWFLLTATPLADDRRNGAVVMHLDITEQKKHGVERDAMGARYRGLLEAAPDAMVVVNQRGAIVLLNVEAERQFGYRRDELLGQKVTDIIPEGFAERLVADQLRSAEDAQTQQIDTGIELQGRRKDGSEFPIELMLSPLGSAEGILVTAAIRNITARKAAEAHLLQKMEELNRSNEELDQFATVASHDLQEPLRMVAGYTKLLSARYQGKLGADADEFIGFALSGAVRMERLINDLLTYSRVRRSGMDLRSTSSEDALQEALMRLRGAIQDRGALVTHDPLPNVLADKTQLTQLFQNLVGNAIKYQGPGIPKVHIGVAKASPNRWVFSVKDNGLGIDSKHFERIFGMFQRLHKPDEFAGTGIGLAICKKIVERHGGNISVESQPGEGSTFRFALTESERIS